MERRTDELEREPQRHSIEAEQPATNTARTRPSSIQYEIASLCAAQCPSLNCGGTPETEWKKEGGEATPPGGGMKEKDSWRRQGRVGIERVWSTEGGNLPKHKPLQGK
jgi:hypothetical protein